MGFLGGRISLNQDDNRGNRWRETYDIWCCTSETETICEDGNARYLTFELEDYNGSIYNYKLCNEKLYLCKRMRPFSSNIDVIGETSLVLPPTELIVDLDLQFMLNETSWSYGTETVIVCNNTKGNYYRDPISSNIYIKKKYLDKYLENHTIKYFAFTERLVGDSGYRNETSLHFEIKEWAIIKEIPNYSYKPKINYKSMNEDCDTCPIKIESENRIQSFKFEEFFMGEDELED